MLAILPQIEQAPLFDAYNFNLAAWDKCNQTVVERLVESYLCPSEPPPDQAFVVTMAGERLEMAYASYVGNLGSDYIVDYFDYGPAQQPDGVLFRRSSVRAGDITDGTSHTLMVGERVHPDPLLRPVWAFGATGKVVGDTSSEILTPSDWRVSWGFSSYHTSGAQFVMADGSVTTLSRSLDLQLFRSLSTRAGAESTAQSAY